MNNAFTYPQELKTEAIELFKSGLNAFGIEVHLNIHNATIGRWLRKAGYTPGRKGYDKICPVCNKSYYIFRHEVTERGMRPTCSVECLSKLRKSLLLNAKEKNGRWKGGIREYNKYKHVAERRKLEFQLSKEEFDEFCGKSCHYCGSEMIGIGIDRVDNTKGYITGNVVPCCKFCNLMKRTLTEKEFINHIKKIYDKNFK